MKASVVSGALQRAGIEETIVHSGQHYDDALSAHIIEELGITQPHTNLRVGSLPHGQQTGLMMHRLDAFLDNAGQFDAVLVYGDTNSTLAGALVAAKRHIPVAHVEAGLRSFDRSMPEEINRVVTDHISTWLFCPTSSAVNNLSVEGIRRGVFHVGDVMLDAVKAFSDLAGRMYPLHMVTRHSPGTYIVATIHRPVNNQSHARLSRIVDTLGHLGNPVILPAHPATAKALESLAVPESVEVIGPVGYLKMCTLIRHAKCVVTDSGGLQKEAYWHRVPCVTLRPETEWPETLQGGWNTCVNDNPDEILLAVERSRPEHQQPFGMPGEGTASEGIAQVLSKYWQRNYMAE